MDNRLNDIQKEIKDINKSIHNIDKTLAVNTASLQEHMKRTKANEQRIENLEKIKYYAIGAIALISILAALRELNFI